jgi:type VI secretion system protein ImpH
MAREDRSATDAVAVLQRASREPYQFDFFVLLRWLESCYRDRPRIARSERPADDLVRLGQVPSLAFAPSTVAAFEPENNSRPAQVDVHFFGLFGPQGALPVHLTEYARDRWHNAHDPTLVRFANIFHHRMLSLFYRAWADAQPTVQYDRAETDRFSSYVGALAGLGMPAFRDRDAWPDNAKLYHAGPLACQTRHADGLRAILADYFQLPVALEEFVGRWIDLPADCLCRLGESPGTGTLGLMAIAGERVWDCVHTFRIVFGPVGLATFVRLLPDGDSLARVGALVRNYLGEELGWELRLVLNKEEVPPTNLGERGQLGWTTWLACETRDRDADDLVLEPVREVA